jgi:hypothetical protein
MPRYYFRAADSAEFSLQVDCWPMATPCLSFSLLPRAASFRHYAKRVRDARASAVMARRSMREARAMRASGWLDSASCALLTHAADAYAMMLMLSAAAAALSPYVERQMLLPYASIILPIAARAPLLMPFSHCHAATPLFMPPYAAGIFACTPRLPAACCRHFAIFAIAAPPCRFAAATLPHFDMFRLI